MQHCLQINITISKVVHNTDEMKSMFPHELSATIQPLSVHAITLTAHLSV